MPAHGVLQGALAYRSELPLTPGALVRVPLGSRELLGIVWAPLDAPPAGLVAEQIKTISAHFDTIAPLDLAWRRLVDFAARYYQRSVGEVALAALPPQLRALDMVQMAKRLKKRAKAAAHSVVIDATHNVALNDQQTVTLAKFSQNKLPTLLFGATGSGKTEVYLHAVQSLLESDPLAQVLVMVPEINLTPQLEARFSERFGAASVVAMHSGMTPAQRLQSWLAAHMGGADGGARIILGTRMAVLASIPRLRLIIVDEEHDPSYKAQDGARHSARDLAVYRAKLHTDAGQPCQVLLGSATPSLESWQACEKGRYTRLAMPLRVGGGALAQVKLVDMRLQPPKTLFAPALLEAIGLRVARGEQCLVFLNRRGYSPVLACGACGWKSECPHCSAYRVFHKIDRSLRCHHCGLTEKVPRACPECGNIDIAPVGRGTEKLEEQLTLALSGVLRPDGSPLVIARMDADTTRLKGALEEQLAHVHSGSVDILVGTQMVAKGHDFRRITLVAAVNPDAALFSQDFRAPERLFSLLMQAAGRAGRDAAMQGAQMWIQTNYPEHSLFSALQKHDYPGFAAGQLAEREQAGLPPFSFQALVRAEARTQEVAQSFLQQVSEAALAIPAYSHITLYPSVPMSVQRVADVERAQMLVESQSRAALQSFLSDWQVVLRESKVKGLIRWAMDVDPLAI